MYCSYTHLVIQPSFCHNANTQVWSPSEMEVTKSLSLCVLLLTTSTLWDCQICCWHESGVWQRCGVFAEPQSPQPQRSSVSERWKARKYSCVKYSWKSKKNENKVHALGNLRYFIVPTSFAQNNHAWITPCLEAQACLSLCCWAYHDMAADRIEHWLDWSSSRKQKCRWHAIDTSTWGLPAFEAHTCMSH